MISCKGGKSEQGSQGEAGCATPGHCLDVTQHPEGNIQGGGWINNHEEQHRDHLSLCNLEIKWQMEFHMDKVMHTLNKNNKSQFHLKIDMP